MKLLARAEHKKIFVSERLMKIFVENKGGCQVYLNESGKWKRLDKKISDDKKVIRQLKDLLGDENVRIY